MTTGSRPMGQTLTIQLSQEAYARLLREAEAAGRSPAELAATWLERQCGSPNVGLPPRDTEDQAARERFERHFGRLDLGYATGVDNEQIDADLARQFADDHETD